MASAALRNLIKMMASLPGLGPRSAQRAVLHLLSQKEKSLAPLTAALGEALETIKTCSVCANMDTVNPCSLCQDMQRDTTVLCVVATVADIWAIERSGHFKGRYHVLGGLLSALDGVGPNQLNLHGLKDRCDADDIKEIILALNATVDGQTTAHYIADMFEGTDITITGLARGIPVGGELDYLDENTITTAFKSRKAV
jgi:recombination protein RecR